jgi:hypothetical protein
VDQYRELRAKAFPRIAEPEPLPVDAPLTRVDYDLLISGDLATGNANLTIDVLKDAWVRVPIPGGPRLRQPSMCTHYFLESWVAVLSIPQAR